MQKRTVKRLLKLSIVLGITILAMQIETRAQSSGGSALSSPTTASADKPTYEQLVQMNNKLLDVVAAQRTENEQLKNENAGWKRYAEAADALDKAKDKMIEMQDKRYDRLASTKCSTTSWLFGLRKKKECF